MTQHELPEAQTPDAYEDDTISLKPYFDTLWRYWRVIALAVATVAVVFVVVVGLVLLVTGSERVASIQFRLLFEGAAQNKYPNGVPFSPTEIVATPVVSEVFAANDLKRFGTYESFKSALVIQQSNPDLDLLGYEYRAKLSDTKLTPVDRARVEEEFRRKRETLIDPVFSIALRRSERFTTLPQDLAQKVLTDTLNIWAQQAAERKGAVKYNIPMFSRNIFPRDFVASEDYIVGIDILRSKVERILRGIDQVAALPGAQIIRVGKEQVALAEVRASLEDILRFKVQPLVGFIRLTGLSRDPRMLSVYLENQLFQIKLDRQQATSKVERLQQSLREYLQQRGTLAVSEGRPGGGGSLQGGGTPAMIPQFGESFLDRIVEMSTKNNDVKYRQDLTDRIVEQSFATTNLEKEQAYYEDLSRTVKDLRPTGEAPRQATMAELTRRFTEAIEGILTAVDQVNLIYDEISKRNLNPSTMLYAVTVPFTWRTERMLSLRSVALSFITVMMLTLILVPGGCLVHNTLRRQGPK